jgi:O-antigen/teichoic acid export membrane protein
MVGISMFGAFLAYSDRVLLGYLLRGDANAQIAIYTLATSLASMVALLAGSITTMLLPVTSGLVSQRSTERITKATQTSLRWILFSTIPFAVFFSAFAAPSLRVLYGAAYEPGALALMLFSIGTLLSMLGAVQGILIAAHRMVKLELTAFIIGAIVNVVLNVLLIPSFGINGSAFASMVSMIVVAVISHFYASRRFGFSIPVSVYKNLLAGALVFLLLLALEQASYGYLVNLPLQISDGSLVMNIMDKVAKVAILSIFFAIGSLAYLVLINVMRLFEREDRHVFDGLLAKTGLPAAWRARISRIVFWHLRLEA